MAEASATRSPSTPPHAKFRGQHRVRARSHCARGAGMMGRDRGAAHERVDVGVGAALAPGRRLGAPKAIEPAPAREVAGDLDALANRAHVSVGGEEVLHNTHGRARGRRPQPHHAAALGMEHHRPEPEPVIVGSLDAWEPGIRLGRRGPEQELDVGHRQIAPRLEKGVQAAREHGAWSRAEEIGTRHVDGRAVEAHLGVERAGLLPGVLDVGGEMILEISAHARQMHPGLDADLPEVVGVTDARQHEELRRVEHAAGEQHLALGRHPMQAAAPRVLDARRPRAFEDHARR